jgi:DNA-binding NarL/FixJ family response regulator
VLVCDDHEVYRLGLRALLTEAHDIALIAETTDPDRALAVVFDSVPDVVLVGQRLAGGGALDLIRRLGQHGTGVIVLADSEDEGDLIDALRAGARGYLARRGASHLVLDGIRAVARRETALGTAVAGHLLRYLDDDKPERSRAAAVNLEMVDALTPRQREVTVLVADGLSNAEVAARLFLSPATVKSHLTIILKRLNLRDRTQLAILVNRSTLLDAGAAADPSHPDSLDSDGGYAR